MSHRSLTVRCIFPQNKDALPGGRHTTLQVRKLALVQESDIQPQDAAEILPAILICLFSFWSTVLSRTTQVAFSCHSLHILPLTSCSFLSSMPLSVVKKLGLSFLSSLPCPPASCVSCPHSGPVLSVLFATCPIRRHMNLAADMLTLTTWSCQSLPGFST